jgi:3'(2'), 5'-bisphosphate nucleotidase
MLEKELQAMIEAARAAGRLIKEVYATSFEIELKSDGSPVTSADKRSDSLIREMLGSAFPNHAFLTEEGAEDPLRLRSEWVFIVDPLDGTKDFVAHDDEFATNIALCHHHEIVAGVINIPMKKVMYYAVKSEGAYAWREGFEPVRIHVSSRLRSGLRVLVSRNFFGEKEKETIARHRASFESVTPVGSALKFGLIAEGQAELSYRLSSGTKEWDVAAGDLLLTEAGGAMAKPDGTRYAYNRRDVYNREGYIICNDWRNALL